MKALQQLRHILKSLAQEVEVLPVVGGAVEELKRPDFEEREDQALNEEEKVFETIFERDPSGAWPSLYRSVPPLGRTQAHLFRYFLDGSFRSYFLGTVLEHERESPVHFAQIGACVLSREDDGLVRRKHLQVDNILLAGKERLSDALWVKFANIAGQSVKLVDLTEEDIVSRVLSDFDLGHKAGGKVMIFVNELNKYAPAREKASPIIQQLLGSAERGRSLQAAEEAWKKLGPR